MEEVVAVSTLSTMMGSRRVVSRLSLACGCDRLSCAQTLRCATECASSVALVPRYQELTQHERSSIAAPAAFKFTQQRAALS